MIRPLRIGSVTLDNNLILAPMAGVTDGAFRLICQTQGAGLTVSELASARAIINGNSQTRSMLCFPRQPRPYSIQIFGADPETVAEAARMVESWQVCDMIDLNMGCPVAKVVKTGSGSALMKTPELAERILRAVKKAVTVPVTVKCRIGWTLETINVRDFVTRMIAGGADLICVHTRTREDAYAGTARWEYLEGLQDLCGAIPLIGNGDLHSREDLHRMQEISGCRGWMIGRGAIGRPWIFRELSANPDPDADGIRRGIFREHFLESLMEHGSHGVALFRVHLFNYLKGHPVAGKIRREMCLERDPARVMEVGLGFL